MKRLVGWLVSATAFAAATGASAQVLQPLYDIARLPLTVVSDFGSAADLGGPYAAMPPEAPAPRYVPYGYAPALLPPREVYGMLRENGYSPLGTPQQRGMVYIIAAINPDGDDGRIVIDARTGRILRFMPAFRMGHLMRRGDDVVTSYGAAVPLPPAGDVRPGPQPSAPLPRIASRTPAVPLPKPAPHAVAAPKDQSKPVAATPAPAQQSAAVQSKPAETTGAAAAAPAVVPAAKPAVAIQPTQDMPAAQGLE